MSSPRKFALWALLASAILFGACLPLATAWQPEDGALQLGLAVLIGAAGALAGAFVSGLVLGLTEGPQARVNALYAAIGVRMLATLTGALVVVLMAPFALLPFGVWIVVQYVLLLGLEVFVSLRDLGQNPARQVVEQPPEGSRESVDETDA